MTDENKVVPAEDKEPSMIGQAFNAVVPSTATLKKVAYDIGINLVTGAIFYGMFQAIKKIDEIRSPVVEFIDDVHAAHVQVEADRAAKA